MNEIEMVDASLKRNALWHAQRSTTGHGTRHRHVGNATRLATALQNFYILTTVPIGAFRSEQGNSHPAHPVAHGCVNCSSHYSSSYRNQTDEVYESLLARFCQKAEADLFIDLNQQATWYLHQQLLQCLAANLNSYVFKNLFNRIAD